MLVLNFYGSFSKPLSGLGQAKGTWAGTAVALSLVL